MVHMVDFDYMFGWDFIYNYAILWNFIKYLI